MASRPSWRASTTTGSVGSELGQGLQNWVQAEDVSQDAQVCNEQTLVENVATIPRIPTPEKETLLHQCLVTTLCANSRN